MCGCYSNWNKDVKGRNAIEMFYRLFTMVFKIGWGLW